MRTLHTTLCTLEPQTVAHAQALFAVLSDPAIYEFENAPPVSLAWLTERFAKLESRASKDGSERWLNWVVRLPGGELAGYVQATVLPTGVAYVAYELGSRFWRRGIGRSAVQAMLDALVTDDEVHTALAVLKASNYRSSALLRHLGFTPADAFHTALAAADTDEIVMQKAIGALV